MKKAKKLLYCRELTSCTKFKYVYGLDDIIR